ncbi:MAG: GFA family protein [Betaproteobacteria bacterium]|nr:GFA family protein [Betaproteobacteria bacterium]
MKTIEAQCRCGAIGLKITGEPVAQIYCHCDDCRAAHGAAYVASSIYPAQSVQVERGQPAPVVVKATQRMRCVACGTHLFSEIASVGLRSVNAFLLPKGEFNPQLHVQCQHAVLPVVDNLPHYKGFPASFGGAEEFVAW